MIEAGRVLDFWSSGRVRPYWWRRHATLDGEIRARFKPLYERAARGRLRGWDRTPEGALALILLFDQFPRNMYRGTPRAFATDDLARAVADRVTARGFDLKVPVDLRIFFYMPYEHCEDLEGQERCVALVRARCDILGYPRYAVAHRDVVAQFGRFPHRNAILGRANTPEEEEYLKDPNAGFG